MKKFLIILSLLLFISSNFIFAKASIETINSNVRLKTKAFKRLYNNFVPNENTKTIKETITFAGYWLEPLYTGTDINESRSYSTMMQTTINTINERHDMPQVIIHSDIDITKSYYGQIETLFTRAFNNETVVLPDIFMISNIYLIDYYNKGYLDEIYKNDLNNAGVTFLNSHAGIRSLGTINKKTYGYPIGHDLLVWFVNLELFKKAGLVDKKGNPILPKNVDGLKKQATLMKERTGYPYLGVDFVSENATRMFLTLLWQNESGILVDGRVAFDSLSTRNVAENFYRLFLDNKGLAGRGNISLLTAFNKNQLAVFVNSFSYRDNIASLAQSTYEKEIAPLLEEQEKLKTSSDPDKKAQLIPIPAPRILARIVGFPRLYNKNIVWGNTNLIVLRHGLKKDDINKYNESLKILKEINENDKYLAKNGILPNDKSSLKVIFDAQSENRETIFSNKFIELGLTEEYYKTLTLQDINQTDKYTEILELLAKLSDDIVRQKVAIRSALANTQDTLVDLLEKKTDSLLAIADE